MGRIYFIIRRKVGKYNSDIPELKKKKGKKEKKKNVKIFRLIFKSERKIMLEKYITMLKN